MKHDLLVFVSVSSIYALAGCTSAPIASVSSLPPIVHVTAPLVHPTTVLHPLNVEPKARHTPLAAAQPPSAQTITPVPSATPMPSSPTATPTQPPSVDSPTAVPAIPVRLLIPAISLDVPIVSMGWSVSEQNGQSVSEWDVPDWRAAGWLKTSALVGISGNTVLEGHQDINGRVFEDLEYLKEGDEIQVQTAAQTRKYIVALRTIVPEKDQPVEVRRENARWIGPSNDERLTLVTCWPRDDNTHRLILVALPAP